MPAYELRSGGDVKNKKQSVADLKYRRLTELNARLKEDLDRPRVKVSEAALSNDSGLLTVAQVDKREDPYAPQQQGGCCTVIPSALLLRMVSIVSDKKKRETTEKRMRGSGPRGSALDLHELGGTERSHHWTSS
ncbi:G-protein complex gamma subunit Ste18/GpgA [Aspergillus luchuensis]|uniref:G-protein complex gamma subunit Ste18/GpgA n=1 Tax=Aspergillus kawachii TaxID=1069201 RepID=A0A146FNC3_ASPKA|nr:G-protein complex gamma subunit Ste18/GpgA [Aspergillus luchuensis]